MTAREYLKQIIFLDCKIDEKKARVRVLKEGAEKRTSNLTPDKVQASGAKDKVGNAVCSYVALEAEIEEDKRKRDKIIGSINLLPPFEATVLYKYYVSYKSLKEISRDMRKSYSWVAKTHSSGLLSMQRLIYEGKVGV